MEWHDKGLVLTQRRHGESAAIVELFTPGHGRHAGVVRGGGSRRMAAMLQPGTEVAATWRARLADHIGAFTLEPVKSRAAALEDPVALAGLASVCALLAGMLAERDPHPELWPGTAALLDALGAEGWADAYLRWELALLDGLGVGLDLSACAVTGGANDLSFVSPKTGRAVSRAGAGDWADRLLPLPEALLDGGPFDAPGLSDGLALTGHFLAREWQVLRPGQPLPGARLRLVQRLTDARLRDARP
jgi:DNA repair protein RecO (recombination protein O)